MFLALLSDHSHADHSWCCGVPGPGVRSTAENVCGFCLIAGSPAEILSDRLQTFSFDCLQRFVRSSAATALLLPCCLQRFVRSSAEILPYCLITCRDLSDPLRLFWPITCRDLSYPLRLFSLLPELLEQVFAHPRSPASPYLRRFQCHRTHCRCCDSFVAGATLNSHMLQYNCN